MRPQQVTITTTGASNTIPLDTYLDSPSLAIHCFVSGTGDPGSVTFQYTLNDVLKGSAANWNTLFTFVATTAVVTNLPATAVRLNATGSVSGATSTELTVLQYGPSR